MLRLRWELLSLLHLNLVSLGRHAVASRFARFGRSLPELSEHVEGIEGRELQQEPLKGSNFTPIQHENQTA